MKLKKDKKVIVLTNDIQIAAFKKAGYEEIKEKEDKNPSGSANAGDEKK
ncbi:MAG: hypothetical protein PHU36_07845 [Syntrophomonadaceae bacterium]|nr:hypothetical protein [Syntrophomonadaceae bacterium]